MNRENRRMVLFIVFLIFLAIIGLFVKMTVFRPEPYPNEGNVAGLVVQFRDGITGQDAKNIIENYNFTAYKIDCPVYDMPDKYYIKVDKDKIIDVRNELNKENWTSSTLDIEKGDYYIITISEQTIKNKNFLAILDRYNLQVEKFVYCYIRFGEHPLSGISKEHANELKSELEMNENIFTIYFEVFE